MSSLSAVVRELSGDHPARRGATPAVEILWGAGGLVFLGLLMVYSATSVTALGGSTAFLKRSLVWAALGWGAFFVARRTDYRWWLANSRWMLLVAFVLLVAVLVPGIGAQVNGSRRWFRSELWSFQPSEVVKFVLPLFVAGFLARKWGLRESLGRGLLPPILVLGATVGLLMCEPDFGTSVLVSVVVMSLLVVGGVRSRSVLWLVGAALPLLFLAVWSSPYRWQRLTTFLDPWADPQGKGYQVVQSQVALGSGGVLGRGIGAGQQKLHYVPSIQADFILAQIGEETGLAGVTAIFILFAVLFRGCYRAARGAPDAAGTFAALGILFTLGFQAMINIAVVVGMAPTKGIPLPLVSSGGTSLVFTLAALGVVANISDQSTRASRAGAP